MGSLMRFLVFPSLVKRKCQGKDCSISGLLCLSSGFPVNIDPLVSSPPLIPAQEKEILGGVGPSWAGLGWAEHQLLWAGRTAAGQGGEPAQLRGPRAFICCGFMTFYKSHMEQWKRPRQGIRKPALQNWLDFSQAVWPQASQDLWSQFLYLSNEIS